MGAPGPPGAPFLTMPTPPQDPSTPPSSAAGRPPQHAPPFTRRLASPGKIIALAVVANLLIAGSVAAAVAPVQTGGAALGFYDSLPDWLRTLLGDERDENGDMERGWLGAWLDRFHKNAVKGNPKAQLGMPISLAGAHRTDTWTPNETVDVTWVNHGATLTYRLTTSDTSEPPDLLQSAIVETTRTHATLPLQPGENWVHVQPSHRDFSGKVSTLGPFLSDPDPPTAPDWLNLDDAEITTSFMEVHAYQFTLGWNEADARSGITAYHLERRLGANSNWQNVVTLDAANTTHTERNRPNGQYHYRVIAESAAGLLSEPSTSLTVRVDAQGSLSPPGVGQWHYGVNAIYDSVIHIWDISDPDRYSTIDQIHAGNAGLSKQEVDLYTGDGWGITLDNATMRSTVAGLLGAEDQNGALVGGERNTLQIGLTLFEWMFNEVDYDFNKFSGTDFDLLRANEVLDAGGGICGDLTALFVTLMRIAGVPARPVHGYLINQDGAPGQDFQGSIGGFHMWPEIYVGGQARDGPGGGWIPIDVSGVTGDFKPELLHVYFGVANPNYLQLGIQKDLGSEALADDHERNRWNVWANLRHWSIGGNANVQFQAETELVEHEAELGNLWFTPGTNERVWCPEDDDECRGDHTSYFQNIKGRSERSIDYGAVLSWTGDVQNLELTMRYPVDVGPTQVVMWTAYQRDANCTAIESNPTKTPTHYLKWEIPGSQQPCGT